MKSAQTSDTGHCFAEGRGAGDEGVMGAVCTAVTTLCEMRWMEVELEARLANEMKLKTSHNGYAAVDTARQCRPNIAVCFTAMLFY